MVKEPLVDYVVPAETLVLTTQYGIAQIPRWRETLTIFS